jgi:hypothetical protein
MAGHAKTLADMIRDRQGSSSNGKPEMVPVEAPGYRPFPLDSLPNPVRNYVDASAVAIGCDLAYVALPMLSALAGAIGNTRRVQVKRGWTEPAVIWTAIVGESGTHKSPALDDARRFPRRRQEQARKRFDKAMREYEVANEKYQAALTKWKDSDRTGERPQSPERPVMVRALVDDTTVEALGPILVENWHGILILRDELAGWLGAFDRYARSPRGGGEAAKWIEMHGGRSIIIDRKTGMPRTLFVPRAAVSIGGGIQPGILCRLITQEHRDNGLLARLLMAWPPRRPRRWSEAQTDESVTAAVQSVYDRLCELVPTKDSDGDPTPIVVPLAANAKAEFINFVNAHGAEQFELAGDLAAAWSKLEGYAARLALVHHLVRWAAGDRRDPETGIDTDSIRAGITLARWFGGEDRRIYAALHESGEETERRELVELIRRRGGKITVRELQRAGRRYTTAEAAETALGALAKKGIGEWVPSLDSPMGGQPTRVFRLFSAADS